MPTGSDACEETVGSALSHYLRESGMKTDARRSPTVTVELLGQRVQMPNPRFQRDLLATHDLHHVLTGYGTDLVGEAELGAWELATGSGGHWFVWLNNVLALGLGVLSPLRTARALRRGLACRSLYNDPRPYDALLGMSLEVLRRELGLEGGSGLR